MGKAKAVRYLSQEEVERRIQAISASDCARLEQLARLYAYGSSWTAEDLRQEAIQAALERREWRADMETIPFLVGAMRSIADSKRKSAAVAPLDRASARGEVGPEDLDKVRDDSDPARLTEEAQAADLLVERLLALFADDPQVLRAIEGRMAGEPAAATREALGLTESQYETVCRRLVRGYQNSIKEKL